MSSLQKFLLIVCAGIALAGGTQYTFAQNSPSVLFIPLIGITSVPDPAVVPTGGGTVTYRYAVKNFLVGAPITNVAVVDDTCSPVLFVEGDDNHDSQLDSGEVWRYSCSKQVTETTKSQATASGLVNDTRATRSANAVVVVGSALPAPTISVNNISAIPQLLPVGGGNVIFTYRVNNPGTVALADVSIEADQCPNMSSKLGDTNGNGLLDIGEVWMYTCTATIQHTTQNTVTVEASGSGMKTSSSESITVRVEEGATSSEQNLFDVGINIGTIQTGSKGVAWTVLAGILAMLCIYFLIFRKEAGSTQITQKEPLPQKRIRKRK